MKAEREKVSADNHDGSYNSNISKSPNHNNICQKCGNKNNKTKTTASLEKAVENTKQDNKKVLVEEVNEKFDKLVINEEEDEAPVKPKTTRKKKQPKIILED